MKLQSTAGWKNQHGHDMPVNPDELAEITWSGHTGHTPGDTESWQHLPVDEVSLSPA